MIALAAGSLFRKFEIPFGRLPFGPTLAPDEIGSAQFVAIDQAVDVAFRHRAVSFAVQRAVPGAIFFFRGGLFGLDLERCGSLNGNRFCRRFRHCEKLLTMGARQLSSPGGFVNPLNVLARWAAKRDHDESPRGKPRHDIVFHRRCVFKNRQNLPRRSSRIEGSTTPTLTIVSPMRSSSRRKEPRTK